jgi:adenylate cyclase
MRGLRRRDAVAALLIAIVIGAVAALPAFDVLRGVSIDVLTWLRWEAYGPRYDPRTSTAVVVALDEETYRTPPFADTPYVTWTRDIGNVLGAVIDGGAKVVGFDIILPTSIEQSTVPVGDQSLGEKVKGFDRDFLRALALGARAGKVVLGEAQHQDLPIRPFAGQRLAVGQQRNIRSLNLFTDPDEIVRRVPLSLTIDGAPQASMSVELASRALGKAPEMAADGTLTLGDALARGAVPNTLTVNFEGGADGVPTYSLADLRACREKGDTEFFRRNFDGRVVLIGAVLDIEDQKMTSKRFATGIEGAHAERCALPAPAAAADRFARASIAGVYIHATAVNNMLRGEGLREFGRAPVLAINVGFAVLAAAVALVLAPISTAAAVLAASLAWAAIGTVAFAHALALPLIDPILAGIAAAGAMIAYRFMLADHDKRLLRKSFALYLSPAVIEKMLVSDKPPQLGGETRSITVYFSDVAGFSSFSEKLDPKSLVELMNEYLSAMTDIIEAHGGYVDKYIGDAVVAMFGAPLDNPNHALSAVQAALECGAKLEELNRTSPAFKGFKLGQRIGLNSGEAVVGNMGSRRRFNYTMMGDIVNLASRLEGANKYFSTAIMASDDTVRLAGPSIAWRELDQIRVKGRGTPVKIFEPLAATGQETPAQKAAAAVYAEGLACWRARDFEGAAAAFARIAGKDPPSALFLERARKYAAHPPGPDWEPVNTLEGK